MDLSEMQRIQQQAAAFRQMTGGLPATVYIQKEGNGFHVVVKAAENSPVQAEALVDNLVSAVGLCCQQLGMTVKV